MVGTIVFGAGSAAITSVGPSGSTLVPADSVRDAARTSVSGSPVVGASSTHVTPPGVRLKLAADTGEAW